MNKNNKNNIRNSKKQISGKVFSNTVLIKQEGLFQKTFYYRC